MQMSYFIIHKMQRNIHCLAEQWLKFDTSITQTGEYIKHFVMHGSTLQKLRVAMETMQLPTVQINS